jgi:AraC-like DNA-binding protein
MSRRTWDVEVAMAEVLRTDDVTQADRFAQWRHWISATFVPLECAPVGRGPFRGEVAHWELGDLLVSRVAAEAHLASRTRRMIALRDAGYYKVGLLTHGSCKLSQDGRDALLQPGDLAIYDCRRPYTMVFDEPHEMSFLMFPCDRLRLPPAAVDEVLVTPVSSAQSTGSLVAPFLRRLVANLEQPGEPVNSRLADNVLDLLATLFSERAGLTPADPAALRRSLLLSVHSWIDAHLADPDLDPDTIARANHISVRYLHKLFETEHQTVALYLRGLRLERARDDLLDPRLTRRSIARIAHSCGFGDISGFNRAFKATYGINPSDLRRGVPPGRIGR